MLWLASTCHFFTPRMTSVRLRKTRKKIKRTRCLREQEWKCIWCSARWKIIFDFVILARCQSTQVAATQNMTKMTRSGGIHDECIAIHTNRTRWRLALLRACSCHSHEYCNMIEPLEKENNPLLHVMHHWQRESRLYSSKLCDLYITVISRLWMISENIYLNCIHTYTYKMDRAEWQAEEAVKSVIDFRTSVLNPD